MVKLSVDGKTYIVEFRHITKQGKHAELGSRLPIKAVTVCSVIRMGDTRPDFIAMETAICSPEDPFSRIEGRLRSLKKVLRRCGSLKTVRARLWVQYQNETGVPRNQVCLFEDNELRRYFVRVPAILSDDEKQGLVDAGSDVREERSRRGVEKDALVG
jgi:hypothetical protein